MKRRSLYICYLSLEDPLVHTQVVAYLEGLAQAGHTIHLLTFETKRLTPGRRRRHRRSLGAKGIRWHGLRYHKRPSLPATTFDVFTGSVVSIALVLRHRLDTLHARAHVPAAMALIVMSLLPRRPPALIFDIRGLMAEEYEDAGRWQRDSVPFRLTKAVERAAIRRAAAHVVLTERVRAQLFGASSSPRTFVIPCCADLDALSSTNGQREVTRAALGLGDATVMVYVGKFGGWYMGDEMAEFFRVAREAIPSLRFLILTQGAHQEVVPALTQRGIDPYCTITSAPPEKLGSYLAAADFGISFIRPAPSKASSSPTKIGEYLGAGLPVLATAGVGDLDRMITPDVGVLVRRHQGSAYREATAALLALLNCPAVRARPRALAERELSLETVGRPRYCELYASLSAQGG